MLNPTGGVHRDVTQGGNRTRERGAMQKLTAEARRFAQLAAALTLTGLLIAAVDYLAHAAFDAIREDGEPGAGR